MGRKQSTRNNKTPSPASEEAQTGLVNFLMAGVPPGRKCPPPQEGGSLLSLVWNDTIRAFVSTALRGHVEGYVASAEESLFEEEEKKKKKKPTQMMFTQQSAPANTDSNVHFIWIYPLARLFWLVLSYGCCRARRAGSWQTPEVGASS